MLFTMRSYFDKNKKKRPPIVTVVEVIIQKAPLGYIASDCAALAKQKSRELGNCAIITRTTGQRDNGTMGQWDNGTMEAMQIN
jgi:hypothetical protein